MNDLLYFSINSQINVAITPMINPVMTPICTVKNMAPKMIPIINAIGKVVPSLILRSGELIIVNTVRQMSMKASVAIIVLPTKYRMSGFPYRYNL